MVVHNRENLYRVYCHVVSGDYIIHDETFGGRGYYDHSKEYALVSLEQYYLDACIKVLAQDSGYFAGISTQPKPQFDIKSGRYGVFVDFDEVWYHISDICGKSELLYEDYDRYGVIGFADTFDDACGIVEYVRPGYFASLSWMSEHVRESEKLDRGEETDFTIDDRMEQIGLFVLHRLENAIAMMRYFIGESALPSNIQKSLLQSFRVKSPDEDRWVDGLKQLHAFTDDSRIPRVLQKYLLHNKDHHQILFDIE